ncbi:MAG: hypothetical protein APR63_12125 [Desulfuromonas sp. SDB]|nr:MAG: hypothetical protein APR63_12125 [Desulfuromonas sp. SDB]
MYIIVAGAGDTGSQIIKILIENNHDVVIIDTNREICEQIYAETGAVTINGSATDLGILKDAGVDKADILLCLLKHDSDNIAATVLAKSLGVPRILAFIRKPIYEHAYQAAGADIVIKLSDLLINQIIMEIEQPSVKEIATMGGGKVGIYAFLIPPHASCINLTIKEITEKKEFPVESVFIGIFREKQGIFLIPRGNNKLMEQDRVFIVSKSQFVKKISRFLLQ